MADPTAEADVPDAAVELPSRLVFSLLTAAARVAARVDMPLHRLQDLMRTAYFVEHRRRHPRDLATVAQKLGVSLRTAGTLNRSLTDDFFRPETRVEPLRAVTGALLGGAATVEALAEATELDEAEVRRALTHLAEVGWVGQGADGAWSLTGNLRSFVDEDLPRRIDGVNHQLGIVADSVWSRFVRGETESAGARSWSFAARPADVAAAMGRIFAALRAEAVAAEASALADGVDDRFAITVAVTPLEEEG